jgi:gliding motility-associated-like protein
MKKKSIYKIFAQMPFRTKISGKLLLIGVFLLISFGAYGQDPISIDDVSIIEGNSGTSLLNFTVSVDGGGLATNDIGFTFATLDGSATVTDGDYDPILGLGSIPLGSASTTISIVINGDVVVESDENFFVNLSAPLNATITDSQGEGIINNDDSATITIADVSGAENGGPITVTATLDNAVGSAFTVDVSTADVTATAGTDYTAVVGQTLNFAGTAGEQQTFTVSPTGDTDVEANETLTVSMGNLVGAVVDIADTATVTINNDDSATITIADVSGAENGGPITVTATLDNAVGSAFTVDVSTADVTATAGTDYTAVVGQTLNFAGTAGEQQTFTVSPTGDTDVEANETLTVSMGNLVGAVVDITDTATVTINNDDSATITIADVSGAENGGPITVTATLDNAVGSAFTVDVSTADGTATAGTDYTAVVGQTLNFAGTAGEQQTFTVSPTGDTDVEANETLTVSMGNLVGAVVDITDTATVTINNDDAATITIADTSGAENGGPITVTATLDNAVGSAFTVDVSTANGTATAGTDYTAVVGQTLNFAGTAGEQQTFTVSPTGDTDVEANETLTVSMGNLVGAVVDITDTATVTINNDDSQISMGPDITLSEGDSGSTAFVFTITRTGNTNGADSATFGVTGSGAIPANVDDFTGGSFPVGPVTFLPGETSTTNTINVEGDLAIEPNETFAFTLISSSTGATIGDAIAIGTINNDDSCTAGTTAPELTDTDVPTEFCDSIVQDLDDYTDTAAPPNSILTWSTNANTLITADHLPSGVLVSTAGTYYGFFYDSVNSCASPSLVVVLTLNNSPSPGVPNNANICNTDESGQPTSLDLDDQLAGADPGNWALTNSPSGASIIIGGGNTVEFIGQPLGDYEFTYTTTGAIAPCSNQSAILTITVIDCTLPCDAGNVAPVLNSNVPTEFCDVIDISLNDYINSVAPAGTTLTWSTLSDPLNTNAHLTDEQVANPPNDGSFFAFYYDAVNACASPTLEVEITLNSTPVITDTTGDDLCGPGEVMLTVTGNTPGIAEPPTFSWYDSQTGGNLLVTGEDAVTFTISETTTYFVEAEANGCVSARVPVIATIHPLPSAGIPTNGFACSVSENGPTIVDLDDLLVGESIGEWSVTTDPSGTIFIGTGNIVNFENRTDGDYIFTFTTTDATEPFCENVTSEVTITVNDCDVDTDLDGLFDGIEVALGTDPNNVDTDGDGIEDGVEVGNDTQNPLDEDEDGIIDALDSNILDTDMDGVVDQLDPANTDPCIPNSNADLCIPEDIDLAIEKVADKEEANAGEQVVFTITLTNLTTEMVTDIEVNELLDSNFEYRTHTAAVGTYDVLNGLWEIPELLGDQEVTLVITVEIVSTLESRITITNTASLLSSFPNDGNAANNVSSVDVLASPQIPDDCGIVFNQLSPNGDGNNDILKINCIELFENNSLEIFDRYGNSIFSTTRYNNDSNYWDGTGKNGELPKGTYFYILEFGDGEEVRKGWIQILR